MTQIPHTQHSKIYLDYKEIRENSFRTVISFYEKNQIDIARLDLSEQFDLLVDYADALFESGSHHKHLLASEEIILSSIQHNIQFHNGRDIYKDTLFRRAASFYQLHDFVNSRHVLKELIKITPDDKLYFLLLIRTFLKDKRKVLRHTRAAFIFLCLLAAASTCVELLLVRTFFPLYTPFFELFRTYSLLIGLFVFAFPEFLYMLSAYSKARTIRKKLFE